MLRSSAQGVDPPVCRVLDVAVTYARDSFVDSPAGPFVFSRGAQISWMLLLHMQETVFVDSPAGHLSSRGGGGGADRLASGLHLRFSCYNVS